MEFIQMSQVPASNNVELINAHGAPIVQGSKGRSAAIVAARHIVPSSPSRLESRS